MCNGSDQEASYRAVSVLPVMIIDDIMRAVGSVEEVRAGNVKMASMVHSKQLSLSQGKIGLIMFGNKANNCEAREEVERLPIGC